MEMGTTQKEIDRQKARKSRVFCILAASYPQGPSTAAAAKEISQGISYFCGNIHHAY